MVNHSKVRTLIDRDIYKDIRWGIKFVNGDVGFENRILTLPQWCAFMLSDILREFSPKVKCGVLAWGEYDIMHHV